MNAETARYLTEKVLGECWHEMVPTPGSFFDHCFFCWATDPKPRRTFTTEADMMALYQRLWKKHRWMDFYLFARTKWDLLSRGCWDHEFSAWLFCLSGEGYEERCQMVADFLEGKCL